MAVFRNEDETLTVIVVENDEGTKIASYTLLDDRGFEAGTMEELVPEPEKVVTEHYLGDELVEKTEETI